jgi:hypothetical protein
VIGIQKGPRDPGAEWPPWDAWGPESGCWLWRRSRRFVARILFRACRSRRSAGICDCHGKPSGRFCARRRRSFTMSGRHPLPSSAPRRVRAQLGNAAKDRAAAASRPAPDGALRMLRRPAVGARWGES